MASSPDRVRWPLVAKIGVGLAVLTVVGGLVAAVVAAFVVGPRDRDRSEVVVEGAVDPVAPVALPGGGFLYAERTTGRVVEVDARGSVRPFAIVPDRLRTDGQRGLLGLAVREVDGQTLVYASWTRADDDRLVVGALAGSGTRLVWEGPTSADLANGGTLVFRGDRLLIGIGELQDPGAVDDPRTPNGKVLALDPLGPPGQVPGVVAGGWHNPFALTVAGDDVWLADNAPGPEPERLARIAPDGTVAVVELVGKRAPSSLAVLSDGDLALCGFVSGVVERIRVPASGPASPEGEVGPPCATGVAVLSDGSVVTTTADTVWRDADPG